MDSYDYVVATAHDPIRLVGPHNLRGIGTVLSGCGTRRRGNILDVAVSSGLTLLGNRFHVLLGSLCFGQQKRRGVHGEKSNGDESKHR